MLQYLESHGVAFPGIASVPALRRSFWERDGSVSRMPESAAAYTSWDILLRELESLIDPGVIHRGVSLAELPEQGHAGVVRLDTGEEISADLIVAADGIGSRARSIVAPAASPTYAGYVAWRGLVDERSLSPETVAVLSDSLSSYRGDESVILLYEVPSEDGSIAAGHRRANWVWYEPVAAGEPLDTLMTGADGYVHKSTVPRARLQPRALEHMRSLARRDLAPAFAETVLATPEPFVQKIEDLLLPKLVYGRTVLIGDAASLIRPHIGSGTAKAVEDAISLAEAVCGREGRLEECLRAWERSRLDDHYGLAEYARAVAARLGLSPSGAAPPAAGQAEAGPAAANQAGATQELN